MKQRNNCSQVVVIFVKKRRITVYKSEKKPTNILINKTQESLKKAATLKNDCVMLGAIKEGIK